MTTFENPSDVMCRIEQANGSICWFFASSSTWFLKCGHHGVWVQTVGHQRYQLLGLLFRIKVGETDKCSGGPFWGFQQSKDC